MKNGFDVGVRAAIAIFGTQTALAKALGIKRAAIGQWRQVPHQRVLEIERLSKGAVSRHVMRPDLYPVERK